MKTRDINEKITELLKEEYQLLQDRYNESEKYRNLLESEVRQNDDLLNVVQCESLQHFYEVYINLKNEYSNLLREKDNWKKERRGIEDIKPDPKRQILEEYKRKTGYKNPEVIPEPKWMFKFWEW